MARVVQQRSSPPYLLIIVVFLFLIATTVAVLMYMDADKKGKQLAQTGTTLERLASDLERNQSKIQKLMNATDATVVGAMDKQLTDLTTLMSGTTASFEDTYSRCQQALATTGIGQNKGLIAAALELHEQNRNLQGLVDSQKQLLTARDEEIARLGRSNDDTQQKYNDDLARLNKQLSDLERKLQDSSAQNASQLQTAQTDWGQRRDELERNVTRLSQQLLDAQRQNQDLQGEVNRLRDDIRRATAGGKSGRSGLAQADGRIIKLLDADGVCYINLGTKDRITPGLTFSVYPAATGIPEDGVGKATIEVRQTYETVSQCVIKSANRDDPMVVGDVVANLAFDPLRTFTFVVEGQFDIYGTGKPSAAGTQEVKNIIQRFNGKVVDRLSIETDYVVMGAEPDEPAKPPESAPLQVWEVYREQLKVYRNYQQMRELAQSLNVPILNTNRFLAFIGYNPANRMTMN